MNELLQLALLLLTLAAIAAPAEALAVPCTYGPCSATVCGTSGIRSPTNPPCDGPLTLSCSAPPCIDRDLDGVLDDVDNCHYAPNPFQEDGFSFDQPEPDGRGDACECGDVSDDGAITLLDVVLLRRDIFGLPPGLTAPRKCRVVPGGSCDDADVFALRAALADGNGATLAQVCEAASLGQPSNLCSVDGDCAASLFCQDGICCTCASACQRCDVPGSEGFCTPVPAGQDPFSECGEISCADFFWGFSGDQCLQRAHVSAEDNVCDEGGACLTAAQLCPNQGPGAATLVCDVECQDPEPGTCVETTPGTCTNLDLGTVTCGTSICQTTVPRCVNGDTNICTPLAGEPETCNDIDDDCDGTVDNGLPGDEFEPNDGCTTVTVLPSVGTGQTLSITATGYPSLDHDLYRIDGRETDSSCACCDSFCLDEDYKIRVSLTVPPGGPFFDLFVSFFCGGEDVWIPVGPGETISLEATFDGACPGTDNRSLFVIVRPPDQQQCVPYTLTYSYQQGCF